MKVFSSPSACLHLRKLSQSCAVYSKSKRSPYAALVKQSRSLMKCTVSPCCSNCTYLAPVPIAVSPLHWLFCEAPLMDALLQCACQLSVYKSTTESNWHRWCSFRLRAEMMCCQNLVTTRSPPPLSTSC